jgi:hypothetical protein
MRLKRLVGAATLIAASLATVAPAHAADDGSTRTGPQPGGTEANGSPVAIVVEGPTGTLHTIRHPGAGRAGRWTCHYYAGGGDQPGSTTEGAAAITPAAGQTVMLACTDDIGALVFQQVFVFDPADPLPGLDDPAQAAARALAALPLAPPAIGLDPPATTSQLVGLPTWLWVANWGAGQATASLDGVTATVTATPTQVRWTSAGGDAITCAGPGAVYDSARPADAQHSDCTLLFQTAGPERLTATVTYAVTWTASTGDHGDLDPITRSGTQALSVDQAQALIR